MSLYVTLTSLVDKVLLTPQVRIRPVGLEPPAGANKARLIKFFLTRRPRKGVKIGPAG